MLRLRRPVDRLHEGSPELPSEGDRATTTEKLRPRKIIFRGLAPRGAHLLYN